MLVFVLGRLAQSVPVVFLVSLAVFAVVRLVPGDPVSLALGENAPPERVAAAREQLGLDESVPRQYLRWIGRAVQGDLGTSFQNGLPVERLLRQTAPHTFQLAGVAYPMALFVGIPLGVFAAAKQGTRLDTLTMAGTSLVLAVPGFLVATLLLWLMAVKLGWLPASGSSSLTSDPIDALRHLALPAIAISIGPAAVLARHTRTSVSQVLGEDYIRTATAKGLRRRDVLIKHALRNGMIPVVTLAALQMGQLLAGAVIVEQVFTRPGMGRLVVGAINSRDYPVVQGCLLVLAGVFITVNLAADIAYGVLDPRARASLARNPPSRH